MKQFNYKNGTYFTIDTADIYYEEIGNSSNPCLLILHGGYCDITTMNSLIEELNTEYYILGIDSRGHGKSSLGSKPLTYKQIQEDVETVLSQKGINSVNCIGFSDGGVIALRLAAGDKIQVNKLIAIGASWSVADVEKAKPSLSQINIENAVQIFAEHHERYLKNNPQPDYEKLVNQIRNMWLDTSDTGHPDKTVQKITAETLLIRGDEDFLVSLDSLRALQKQLNECAVANIPFASHVVHEEQKEIVLSLINEFLLKS